MNILEISCRDYPMAMYLGFVQKVLNIIHFVVPIILIVVVSIQLIKLVTDPGDKKGGLKKGLLYELLAAVLIFFLPLIVDIVIGIFPDSFDLPACWRDADEIGDINVVAK